MPTAQAQPLQARRFKTPRTISALILREMETTYGRSPGGYLWAVLEPLGAITLFTVVIALGLKLRSPSIGNNFMLFYATGFLPLAFWGQTANKTAKALKFSRQLLRYPGVRYTDAIIARFLLNFLNNILVYYILFTGIHIAFSLDTHLDVGAILTSFFMAAFLGLGIGSINCFLFSYFPVWDQFWTILTRPLFILSTVIYTFEEIPWRYQDVLWYNPIVHIIGLMRRGFYPTYDAPYVSVSYVFGISLVTLVAGLILLKRYHREILNL